MAVLITRQFSQKLYTAALRTFSAQTTDTPYWSTIFPDGRVRTFEEIPTVEDKNYEYRKIHEMSKQWFQKYGYVAKELMLDNSYLVHLFHFDDFRRVYNSDGTRPLRRSHRAMRQYREERKDLYDNVGLGAGIGEEWWELRSMMAGGITERIIRPILPSMEEVADDLVRMLHIKALEGDIEMLPWLFRWAFENTGVVTLNRRLNALSEYGCEEADKMVEAAGITNEMIALTETDWMNYSKNYQRLVPAQDYMYSVVSKYVDELASEPDSKCVVAMLMKKPENSKKNVLTLTLDMFQGALQTVPLTVLMALYNLARNKHVQETARQELAKLFPSRDTKYSSVVKRLDADTPPYIEKIVLETLRLNPPIIGNGRVLKDDLVLGGYLVPKGTNTILHSQVACLLEENFPEPLKFKPERHPTPHMLHLGTVFGGRGRICLGRVFALAEMNLVLAKILKDFEIFYDGEDVNMINKLHNEPEKPLHLRLHPLV